MSFASWSEFFNMGGYAFYVWASYGLTVLVLAWVMVAPLLSYRALKRDEKRRQRRAARQETIS